MALMKSSAGRTRGRRAFSGLVFVCVVGFALSFSPRAYAQAPLDPLTVQEQHLAERVARDLRPTPEMVDAESDRTTLGGSIFQADGQPRGHSGQRNTRLLTFRSLLVPFLAHNRSVGGRHGASQLLPQRHSYITDQLQLIVEVA